MIIDQTEARRLGQRWLKAGGEWRPGMLATDGGRVRDVNGTTIEWDYLDAFDGHARTPLAKCEEVPDFRDGATKGAALEFLRERLSMPGLGLHAVPPHEWHVGTLERAPHGGLVSEAVGFGGSDSEALVSTLERRR
jgi:hypothetical protein